MEKIVLLTSDSDRDNNLIKCLKALFPECEIDIQSKEGKSAVSVNAIPETTGSSGMEENPDKYLSFP